MKVVSWRINAETAVERIRSTYMAYPENRKPSLVKRKWEVWIDDLSAIKNPTEIDVINVTGNDNWIRIECDVCGSKVTAAAEFEASEWPITICHDCLVDAANSVVMELVK